MNKVLFICGGNVGRSQMAEAFYNNCTGKKLASSAGVEDVGHKYNYVPREDIVIVMKEKEIDISTHKIKKVTPENLQDIDEIIVLCDLKYLPHFVRESGIKINVKEITDPCEFSLKGLREIRDNIEKLVMEYVNSNESN